MRPSTLSEVKERLIVPSAISSPGWCAVSGDLAREIPGPAGGLLAPDLVLIANELYAAEIARMVEGLGLAPAFAVIAG